jgi:GNAT superfamily N-acetyltransferase
MLASDGVTIEVHERLPSHDVLQRAGDAYLAGFGAAPYFETADDRAGFLDRVRKYATTRDGFRLAVAGVDGETVGVGLAVIGRPGDWWREQVAASLTPAEIERWLGQGVLEVVDLAVAPGSRGRGIGARLHDALLADAPTSTAALTADRNPTPARALYERRGWEVLRDGISIAGQRPVVLMVRNLP